MPLPEDKRYTPEEFAAMDLPGRCELINGRIYIGENEDYYREGQPIDMSPSPNILHQTLAADITTDINIYIRKNKGKCRVFTAPTDVKIGDNTIIPDIFVTCDPSRFDKQKHNGAPDWIIEILSPSSKGRDAVDKLALYRESGVREYWIVDPMERRILVYYFEESASVEMYTFESAIAVRIYKDAPEPLVIRLADHL